jgi:CheY-like chemotaxis protein
MQTPFSAFGLQKALRDQNKAALAKTNANNPEGLPKIIFLDVNLPGFSGLDILEKIPASQPMRFIPVVILTSSANPKDVLRAHSLGASGYITKPMDYDNLRDKVHTTLDFWLKTSTSPGEKFRQIYFVVSFAPEFTIPA